MIRENRMRFRERTRALGAGLATPAVRRRLGPYAPTATISLLVMLVGAGYLFFAGSGTTALLGVGPADASYTPLAYAKTLAGDFQIGFSPTSEASTTTGLSWLILLVPFQIAADLLSWPPMLLVKLTGLLLLFGAAIGVFTLARITSGKKWLALVAIAPLVLEPRFVYAAMGGTEHALLAAAISWFLVFRARKQELRASVAAAVAVGIWPLGALLFAAYTLEVIGKITLNQSVAETDSPISAEQLRIFRKRMIAPATVFVAVGAITFFVDGGFLPSTFALNSQPFEVFPGSAFFQIVTTHLTSYSAFETPLFFAAVAIALAGVAAIWHRVGAASLLLPVAGIAYLYMLAGWQELDSPAYSDWNLVALVWPIIAIPLGIGMAHLLVVAVASNGGRRIAEQVGEPIARILPGIGASVLILAISSGWPTAWHELPAEYHRGMVATQKLMIEPARWLNNNSSPDDVVLAVQGAAIRSELNGRSVYDLNGGGSPRVFRRPVDFKTLNEFDVDWVVLWDDGAARSVPELNFQAGFEGISGNEFPLDQIAVWRTVFNLRDVDPDRYQLPRLERLTLEDSLDIGDPIEELSKAYSGSDDRFVYEWTSSYGEGERLTESYSLQPVGGFDRFKMSATPNTPVVLAARYDRTRTGLVTLWVDGVFLGTVQLTATDIPDPIAIMPIPAAYVRGEEIEIEVGYTAATRNELAILHYWALQGDDSLVGRGPDVTILEPSARPVLSDSFSDPDNLEAGLHFPDSAKVASNWRVDGGEWRIHNGQMRQTADLDSDAKLMIKAPGTLEISAEVTWSDGPVGLVFDYIDQQNWSMYHFFPDIQGFHEMRFGVLQNGIYSPVASAPVRLRGSGETMKIEVRINSDGSVSGFLDGEPAGILPSDAERPGPGQVGIMSRSPGNAIDNFMAFGK